jgi:bifunctional DNA-binding transcriptional regulator/antitoxin component of YhaV-PrlF toxin-antitoxin module
VSCFVSAYAGLWVVPLTEAVSFKAVLQRGSRVQVPKPVRWRFQLETSQVLRVIICPVGAHLDYEDFYARMDKSGRITIPKLTLNLLQNKACDGQSLTGAVLEVNIEPA